MDNTPDYLNALDGVAMKHGATTSMTYVGQQLKRQWDHLETLAKAKEYNVFVSVHNDYSGIRRAMQELVETLYRVQGADWHKDVATVREKDKEYGGSWCKRGGHGAFFMLARKWDRIEKQLEQHGNDLNVALAVDTRAEGILDDIGDLRCYLLLVLAWHQAQENPRPVAIPPPVDANTTMPYSDDKDCPF